MTWKERTKEMQMMIKQHAESGLWVTDDGRVIMPPNGRKFKKFRFTYGSKDNKGYMVVSYRGKRYKVHRLICETFHGLAPKDRPTCDHYPDRNPANNASSNLRWASYKMQRKNQQNVENCIEKYGVRRCEDSAEYQRAYYANNSEFAEQCCANQREYAAQQKALGKRRRRCPDGKQHWLTDEEYDALYAKKG